MDIQSQLRLSAFQSLILEAVATGKEFSAVADLLCREAEHIASDAICTLVSIDENGLIRPVAAPSLPASYAEALDGIAIGPDVGSCGSAAYFGEAVQTTDIETDPKWQNYLGLALPLGLLACWSSPIKASDGRVVATFAFYFTEKRGSTEVERELVRRCVQLCAIAYEHSEISARNRFLAYRDQLTGLGNRRSFDAALEWHCAEDDIFGLLMVDIDNLKIVNDSLGHRAGDELIDAVAQRLRRIAGDEQTFRLGGDEFAVICRRCTDPYELKTLAGDILATVSAQIETENNAILPSVTIGGAMAGLDGDHPQELRQNADMALYHAKEIQRGGFLRFDPLHKTAIIRRMDQSRLLLDALDENRVLAYFQPVVELETGRIRGVEALARIRGRDGRIIEAREFQLAFSDTKNAARLTTRMIELAADAFQEWQCEGLPIDHVAINLSTADFHRADLDEQLCDAFGNRGIDLRHLHVEVTECVLMESHILPPLQNLRALGVRIDLDDFGTGHASLTHLLHFPVDSIKIDRSFVERALVDRPSAAIVEALIDIARKIDLHVVAEGVESIEQASWLMALGCQFGQGHLFALPLDRDGVTELLRRNLPDAAKTPSGNRLALSRA